MEIPSTGRAIINQQFNIVEILIPTKKNYLFIFIPLVAIATWFFTDMLKGFGNIFQEGGVFIWFWLAWMGFILINVFRSWLWTLIGEEQIEVSQGVLSISRKWDFLSRSANYDLKEATYFRAEENNSYRNNSLWSNYTAGNKGTGTLCFEYGSKTIKFGENLSETEGNYILKVLRDKKLLTDINFVL